MSSGRMASPCPRSQSPGGQQERSSPRLQNSHPSITRITSNTSSSSSVHPTVFSEASRSRSNTPSSNVSSGDEKDAPKGSRTSRSATSDPNQSSLRSSSNVSGSPGQSPRLHYAQAANSGHRPSQQLDSIPQGEDLELSELSNHHDVSPHGGSPLHRQDLSRSAEGDPHYQSPLSYADRVQTDNSLAAPSRTESWWSRPLEWHPQSWPTRSVYFVRSNMTTKVIYAFVTLVVGLFGAASAAYFAYRTYIMQLWQSEHDYFDWCRQAMQDYPSQECEELLKSKLPPPPFEYSRMSQRTSLMSRSAAGSVTRTPVSVWTFESIFVLALIALCMFTLQIATAPFSYSIYQRISKHQLLFRTGNGMPWYRRQHSRDPFALANVRIESQVRRLQATTNLRDELPDSNTLRYRRIMPVLENFREKIVQEGKGQQQTDSELVYTTPPWKKAGLGDLMPKDRASAIEQPVLDSDDESEKLPVPIQIGDALKGTTDDDKMIQGIRRSDSGTVSNLRRRLRSKRPRLFSMSSRADSWDDVQPPLTALGAEEDSDDKTAKERRQNVMVSGYVAVGLAQAGAALASTAGGTIGKNILVQLVEKESERLHNMLHSGLSRVRTHEEIDYEQDRDDFVHGRRLSQQVRRRTRAMTSSTT